MEEIKQPKKYNLIQSFLSTGKDNSQRPNNTTNV